MINPFEPQIGPQTGNNLLGGISEALARPDIQAAILSGAAQLAQPLEWGQSQFGHTMDALAQAGAGARAAGARSLDTRDAESKIGLREAQASRAGRTGGGAGVGTLAEQREKRRSDTFNIGEQRRWIQMHQREVDRVRRANSALDRDVFLKPEQKAAQRQAEPALQDFIASRAPVAVQDMFRQGRGQPQGGGTPRPGTVMEGFRFIGGDPGDEANWEEL